jgi:HEAT repeat protein
MPRSSPLPDHLARRRDVARAGHEGDEAAARAGLSDPDAGVRAAALGALARIGVLVLGDLEAARADDDRVVRMRVAELAPMTLLPDEAHSLLRGLLDDGDDSVVEMAAWACGEVEAVDTAIVQRLASIATGHRDALTREAAVAALGAIGDDEGLPAILAATRDNPAIRRRAVLALAPFEGVEVDEALRRALEDRDWQVRQAAEDLLSE